MKTRLDDDLVEFAAYAALEECGLTTKETRKAANQFWAIFTRKVKLLNRKERIESAKAARDGFISGVVFGVTFAIVKHFLFR